MRTDVAFACEQLGVSERRACKLIALDRSSYRYEPRPDHNAALRQEIRESGASETTLRIPTIACAGDQARIRRERATRVSADRTEGLMVRRLKRKRLARVAVASHLVRSNQEWALDFVSIPWRQVEAFVS